MMALFNKIWFLLWTLAGLSELKYGFSRVVVAAVLIGLVPYGMDWVAGAFSRPRAERPANPRYRS